MYNELRAFLPLGVVNLGTDQIQVAPGVDKQLYSFRHYFTVSVLDTFVECEAVLQAQSSTDSDEHTKFKIRIALLLYKIFDFKSRSFREHR